MYEIYVFMHEISYFVIILLYFINSGLPLFNSFDTFKLSESIKVCIYFFICVLYSLEYNQILFSNTSSLYVI